MVEEKGDALFWSFAKQPKPQQVNRELFVLAGFESGKHTGLWRSIFTAPKTVYSLMAKGRKIFRVLGFVVDVKME
jgi:hypothetical protein